MTEQAAQFVGSIPENYDRFLGPRIFHDYADDLASRVASLQPMTVLELAAGTGILSERLRKELSGNCALTVTDLNAPMLALAESRLAGAEKTVFEVADATELRYESNSLNVVVCQFGVMFFPDKPGSYQQVLRVLKPTGHYVFNVWGSWANNPFARIAHEVVTGFFPEDPPGFYKVPFSYCDEAIIASSLLAAGFVDVTISAVDLISAIPSADEFATGLVFGNPLYDELMSRGADLEEVRCAIALAISQELGSAMPLQALVVDAISP